MIRRLPMIAVGYLLSASGLVPFSRAVLRYHVCTTAYPSLSDPQRRSRAPDPHINRCEPPSLSGYFYFGLITKEIWGEGVQHVSPYTFGSWPGTQLNVALPAARRRRCAGPTIQLRNLFWQRSWMEPRNDPPLAGRQP